MNTSWESDPEDIHQYIYSIYPYIYLLYTVREDEQCPWHYNIGAKGLSSIYVMMIVNGPIYFLNKPLGNATGKKIPQNKTWVVWFFPGKVADV